MININDYIADFSDKIGIPQTPWELTKNIGSLMIDMIKLLNDNFIINNLIAVHKTAVIEADVNIKAPAIIGKNCFIGANAYLRNGVFLGENVKIGTGCEIKSSYIFDNSAIAHFNFIGDSIIGQNVNFEAGSITANHYNERSNKKITVLHNETLINTDAEKFGSLVGDGSKIGANAVLSPGTLLPKYSIIKRLELIEQVKQ